MIRLRGLRFESEKPRLVRKVAMGKRAAETHHLETPNKRTKYDGPTTNSPLLDQNFILNKDVVDSAIMTDIKKNKWRVGKPFGKYF